MAVLFTIIKKINKMGLQLEDIKNRLRNGIFVSPAENVAYIRGDSEALLAFLIENNPGNVNQTLRKLGYSHLGYLPNKTALSRQLQIFVDKNDVNSINEILNNFNLNRSLLTPEFLKEFDKVFVMK